jgi:integrase
MARSKDRDGIEKRGPGYYRVVIELDPDANRKRLREYHAVHGTLEDAKRLRAKLVTDKVRGVLVGRSKQRLSEYLRAWVAWKRPRVSGRTYERYSSLLESSIIPELGGLKLQHLAPQHLDAYYTASLSEPGQRRHSTLSPTTIHHRHVVLKMALKRAVELGLIPRNPADFATPPKAQRPTLRVLDEAEAGRALALARETGQLPVSIALNTGARLGEILAMRWSDLDLDAGTMAIRRTLVEPLKRGDSQTWYSFKEPKSGKERSVDITAPTVDALRQHRATQAGERLRCGLAWANLDLVVTGPGGEPVRPSSISTRFHELAKTLDRCEGCAGEGEIDGSKCPSCDGSGQMHAFDGLRFHDLRHSHATILLRRGVPPHVVSHRLGHSTVAFTLDRYAHVLPGQQMAAAEAFDKAVSGA